MLGDAPERDSAKECGMQAHPKVAYDSFNPYPWYKYMRETCPVYHNEQVKMWYVFRYNDVQQVLTDTQTFTSEMPIDSYLSASFFRMDPPRHGRYRTLVSQAFTPRSVALMEPRIVAIANELLDAVARTGQMDIVTDLAFPLPATVIMELFGISSESREEFRQLSALFLDEAQRDPGAAGRGAEDRLAGFILPLIEDRRRKSGEDLISRLLAAEVNGEKLSTRDIQATCILMLVAGHETTTRLIGNAMFCFTEDPGVLAELRATPELIPDALEEVMRYRPSVNGPLRITAVEARIGETTIPAGQLVIPQIASANRDETVFPDAERFDIRRQPTRHIGFGLGIHFCMGAPLVRLECKIAFNLLLQRFPDLRRLPDVPVRVQMGPGDLLQGVEHFPATFTPQTR
jgi:cytochrome P450